MTIVFASLLSVWTGPASVWKRWRGSGGSRCPEPGAPAPSSRPCSSPCPPAWNRRTRPWTLETQIAHPYKILSFLQFKHHCKYKILKKLWNFQELFCFLKLRQRVGHKSVSVQEKNIFFWKYRQRLLINPARDVFTRELSFCILILGIIAEMKKSFS